VDSNHYERLSAVANRMKYPQSSPLTESLYTTAQWQAVDQLLAVDQMAHADRVLPVRKRWLLKRNLAATKSLALAEKNRHQPL